MANDMHNEASTSAGIGFGIAEAVRFVLDRQAIKLFDSDSKG